MAEALRTIEAALLLDHDGQAPATQGEPPDQSGDGVEPAQQQGVQAQQGSAPTLVSNLGKTKATHRDTGSVVLAQGFTTGSAPGGYTLASIELDVQNSSVNEAQRNTVRVELWSDSSGSPDSKVASLTVPDSIVQGTNSFAAPANTTLSKDTTYHAVAYSVGDFALQFNLTGIGSEDDGAAAGWSIVDQSRTTSTQDDKW